MDIILNHILIKSNNTSHCNYYCIDNVFYYVMLDELDFHVIDDCFNK